MSIENVIADFGTYSISQSNIKGLREVQVFFKKNIPKMRVKEPTNPSSELY